MEDLGIVLVLSFAMGGTPPYHKLTKHLPEDSLIGLPTVVSVLLSVMIQLWFQFVVFLIMRNDPFNKRTAPDAEDYGLCDANTALWHLANF
jgi:hypothetical protein